MDKTPTTQSKQRNNNQKQPQSKQIHQNTQTNNQKHNRIIKTAKGGVISEFVNPKYADAARTAFKASTRLECMMQDYPKALPPGARVGFTAVNQVRFL